MRENRNFVVPVNILTPVCTRPRLLGPHDTLPCVLIYRGHEGWQFYFGVST